MNTFLKFKFVKYPSMTLPNDLRHGSGDSVTTANTVKPVKVNGKSFVITKSLRQSFFSFSIRSLTKADHRTQQLVNVVKSGSTPVLQVMALERVHGGLRCTVAVKRLGVLNIFHGIKFVKFSSITSTSVPPHGRGDSVTTVSNVKLVKVDGKRQKGREKPPQKFFTNSARFFTNVDHRTQQIVNVFTSGSASIFTWVSLERVHEGW